MADAGKIVITPKGKYNSTTTYEWLDEVTYDGKAYIALKTVTGVTPSDDGVNWRLFLEPNDIVAGNLVPTFTEASTRSNIISEENLSTILGKVKKYFTDLKGHAFNDTVKNLTTEDEGSVLDASQGKVLKDEVDELNSNLSEIRGNAYTTTQDNYSLNVNIEPGGVYKLIARNQNDLHIMRLWEYSNTVRHITTFSQGNLISVSSNGLVATVTLPTIYTQISIIRECF